MEPLKEYMENQLIKKGKKIFISHNTEDQNFGNALFDLIVALIGNDPQKIFYSSKPKYGVPNGGNIIETMKEQYEKNELYFIVISSPRYYNSPKSLNEMGAAWVLNSKYDVFLTKDNDISNLKGVYDSSSIAIQVNQGQDTKDRLDMFAKDIVDFFNESKIPVNWTDIRDGFIQAVNDIEYASNDINESDTDGEIAQTRDIQTLKNLFSNFSVNLIQKYFEDPIYIDNRLPLSYYSWNYICSSYTFHIYDEKLKKLFDEFWDPWNELMRDNHVYYESWPTNPQVYHFYGYKYDVFETTEQENRYNYIIKQGEKICNALQNLTNHINQKYLAINLVELSNTFEMDNND